MTTNDTQVALEPGTHRIHADNVVVNVTMPYRKWWRRDVTFPAWAFAAWMSAVVLKLIVDIAGIAGHS